MGTVQVREARLSERLQAALVGQPIAETPFGTARIERVSAELRDEQIAITGSAGGAGLSLPVHMTTSTHVEDGRPIIRVADASVAGARVPDATRELVEQVLQSEVDAAVEEANVIVLGIEIGDGVLTIRGRPR